MTNAPKSAVIAAQYAPDMIEYLKRRRSVPIKTISDPGPDADQLAAMIAIATRVPDHGKLCPWYLVTFTGSARAEFGRVIREVFVTKNPNAGLEEIAIEEGRFLRAPVVVAVVSRQRMGKSPHWEQILSAGAVCYNLTLAAHAHGFGAVWLTEWIAYDDAVKTAMGLENGRDHIAGLIYIGTMAELPVDRERPDLHNIVTPWAPGVTPNKGDMYDRTEFGFADRGF